MNQFECPQQHQRNYTAAAWLSAALTFLFVIPGLIAVVINLMEASDWKKRTGISPQGYGCLWAVLLWTIAPIIGVILLVTAIIGASSMSIAGINSSNTNPAYSSDTSQATVAPYIAPTDTPVPTITISA